jgi:hypothetical protein
MEIEFRLKPVPAHSNVPIITNIRWEQADDQRAWKGVGHEHENSVKTFGMARINCVYDFIYCCRSEDRGVEHSLFYPGFYCF